MHNRPPLEYWVESWNKTRPCCQSFGKSVQLVCWLRVCVCACWLPLSMSYWRKSKTSAILTEISTVQSCTCYPIHSPYTYTIRSYIYLFSECTIDMPPKHCHNIKQQRKYFIRQTLNRRMLISHFAHQSVLGESIHFGRSSTRDLKRAHSCDLLGEFNYDSDAMSNASQSTRLLGGCAWAYRWAANGWSFAMQWRISAFGRDYQLIAWLAVMQIAGILIIRW